MRPVLLLSLLASPCWTTDLPPCSADLPGDCFDAAENMHVWAGGPDKTHVMFDEPTGARLGLKVSAATLFGVGELAQAAPFFWVLPQDAAAVALAARIAAHYLSAHGATVDVAVLTTLVEELQLYHFINVANVALLGHMRRSGVDLDTVEGGSHSFPAKLRQLRRIALAQHVDTACEIGFNLGMSTLLWLTSGVRRCGCEGVGVGGC